MFYTIENTEVKFIVETAILMNFDRIWKFANSKMFHQDWADYSERLNRYNALGVEFDAVNLAFRVSALREKNEKYFDCTDYVYDLNCICSKLLRDLSFFGYGGSFDFSKTYICNLFHIREIYEKTFHYYLYNYDTSIHQQSTFEEMKIEETINISLDAYKNFKLKINGDDGYCTVNVKLSSDCELTPC